MEKDTKIINKLGSLLSSAELSVALASSNSTCWYTAYQPAEPKGLSKFTKK
jgi:cyclic lactone autoinducer peptide